MCFSLIEDRWIPAIAVDGVLEWIAPHQITQCDEQGRPRWIDLEWGRPDLRIASYELLIGLFATAFAIHDSDVLGESQTLKKLRLSPPPPAQLQAVLQSLAPFMGLDGEGARFLQDAGSFEEVKCRPIQAILLNTDGGGTHFSHEIEGAVLSRKAAAIALYALQAFAPPGGRGHRTSMRGGGPLTTLVVPPQAGLWARIAANLPLLNQPEQVPPTDLSFVFPWARTTRISRGDIKTQMDPAHHTHWLQHYFGMPRRIQLVFAANVDNAPCVLTGEIDERVVTGFRMEAYGTNYGVWKHPLSPYYAAKSNEILPVHPKSGRIGYRDWMGYLFAGGEKDAISHPAETVTQYIELQGGSSAAVRLLVAGYVTDNMKTEDYVEAEIPLLVLSNATARRLQGNAGRSRLLQPAELVATELRRKLIDALGGDYKKTTITNAVEQFWIETESAFIAALQAITREYQGFTPTDDADGVRDVDLDGIIKQWLAVLRRVALDVFRQYAPLDQLAELSTTQRKAIIDANKFLHLFLHGYSKGGQALFAKLELPPPIPKPKHTPSAHGASL